MSSKQLDAASLQHGRKAGAELQTGTWWDTGGRLKPEDRAESEERGQTAGDPLTRKGRVQEPAATSQRSQEAEAAGRVTPARAGRVAERSALRRHCSESRNEEHTLADKGSIVGDLVSSGCHSAARAEVRPRPVALETSVETKRSVTLSKCWAKPRMMQVNIC